MVEPNHHSAGANIEIVFQGSDKVPEMERFVSDEVSRLEQAFGQMKTWRVILEAPKRHHSHSGPLFNVTIRVIVPSGYEITIENHPTEFEAHEDPYKSILDAFVSLQNRLQTAIP